MPPASTQTTATLTFPPILKSERTEGLLLLEGDTFYVNHDGIGRTFYKLQGSPIGLEEFYDLGQARKTFVSRIHHNHPNYPKTTSTASNCGITDVLNRETEGVVRLGIPLNSMQVQEIDQGVFGSAGTGSTTWESSIAMSLYFATQPDLLLGKIIELGSGVGVGGMLLSQVCCAPMVHSLTLTDNNHEVLDQCKKNINSLTVRVPPVIVKKLDWYDYDSHHGNYDTILASDVAYLYPDVVALASCMAGLATRDNCHAKIHMFGPSNRGAFHEAIIQLREVHGMHVQVEGVDLHRYRLKCSQDIAMATLEQECTFASQGIARYLHVTASHPHQDSDENLSATIADID